MNFRHSFVRLNFNNKFVVNLFNSVKDHTEFYAKLLLTNCIIHDAKANLNAENIVLAKKDEVKNTMPQIESLLNMEKLDE